METQIRETYYKAYKDALKEQLNNDDFDWVIKLHAEIVHRICALIPSRHDLHDKIAESMDPVIFRQQLESKTYKPDDFVRLVNYVYDWIKKLTSPARDDKVARSQEALYKSMQDGATFGTLVPEFILSVHAHLDDIHEDMGTEESKKFKELMQSKK